MWIKTFLFSCFCLVAGGSTAAGYVAFITLLGVFEKLAEKCQAFKHGRALESLTIAGVTLFNIIYMFNMPLPFGLLFFTFINLLGGIFTGCLAGALAETLDVFPILSRRINLRDYLPYVLIAAALGRAVGCMVDLLS